MEDIENAVDKALIAYSAATKTFASISEAAHTAACEAGNAFATTCAAASNPHPCAAPANTTVAAWPHGGGGIEHGTGGGVARSCAGSNGFAG